MSPSILFRVRSPLLVAMHNEAATILQRFWRKWRRGHEEVHEVAGDGRLCKQRKLFEESLDAFEVYCRSCSKIAEFRSCGVPKLKAGRCEDCAKIVYTDANQCPECVGTVIADGSETLFLHSPNFCNQCGGMWEQLTMAVCSSIDCRFRYAAVCPDLFHSRCMVRQQHDPRCRYQDDPIFLCQACSDAGMAFSCDGCTGSDNSSSDSADENIAGAQVGAATAVDQADQGTTAATGSEQHSEADLGVEVALHKAGYWGESEFNAWVRNTKTLLQSCDHSDVEEVYQSEWSKARGHIPQQWHNQIFALMKTFIGETMQ